MYEELQKKIGYRFLNPNLLKSALTHSSYLNEHHLPYQLCYERIEFFGDSVLEIFASHYLLIKYPEATEGELTKRRSALVREETLAKVARVLGIGDLIRFGVGSIKNNAKESDSILADTVEALLGAIVLDGSIPDAKRLIHEYILPMESDDYAFDAKTQLQELVQKHQKKVSYRELSESGPDHDKHFVFALLIDEVPYTKGEGKTKKEAQNEAAKAALLKFRDGESYI